MNSVPTGRFVPSAPRRPSGRPRWLLAAVVVLAVVGLGGCFSGLAGQQQITLKATQASFSPDGSRIVFVSLISGVAQIYVANADGSGVRQLTTEGTNAQPTWSPDGVKLLFNSNRGDNANVYELYIMSADGTGQAKIDLEFPQQGS
jgi:hypothetical protein